MKIENQLVPPKRISMKSGMVVGKVYRGCLSGEHYLPVKDTNGATRVVNLRRSAVMEDSFGGPLIEVDATLVINGPVENP